MRRCSRPGGTTGAHEHRNRRTRTAGRGGISAEMDRRPQWSGDGGRLTRTVALLKDRLAPLLGAVERAARDLRHKADVHEEDEAISFSLRTPSGDAVTRLDLELARPDRRRRGPGRLRRQPWLTRVPCAFRRPVTRPTASGSRVSVGPPRSSRTEQIFHLFGASEGTLGTLSA